MHDNHPSVPGVRERQPGGQLRTGHRCPPWSPDPQTRSVASATTPQIPGPSTGETCLLPTGHSGLLIRTCPALDGPERVKAAIDASGSADYGSIDALTVLDEDSYKILGDWGEIIVQSEAPSMSIDPTHTG